MSTIASRFAQLLQLPLTMPDLAISEARNKLSETTMIVNDAPVYLSRVHRDYIEVVRRGESRITPMMTHQINFMDYFLPESGCYLVNGRYQYLQKVAKRQWKKSFTWDTYQLTNTDSSEDVYQLFGQTPVTMYVDPSNHIYYNDLRVGRVRSEGGYTLTNSNFKYEVEEFMLSEKVKR